MAIAGKNGGFYLGANKVAEIGEWKLDSELDTEETTNFDSAGAKEHLPTLSGWKGSASGNWKQGDANGQLALENAHLQGTIVAVEFRVSATAKYTGQAIVTKMGVTTQVKGKVERDFDLQGTGPLTPVYT